jgi:hypothetical protein
MLTLVIYRDAHGDAGPLGRLVSVHRDRSGCVLWIILGFLAVCIVGSAAVKGLPASVAVAMGVVLAAGVVLLRWMAARRGTRRVALYERGIVARAHPADRTLLFEDVVRIVSRAERSRLAGLEKQSHLVEGPGEARVEFTLVFDRALDLLEAIHVGTLDRLRTQALRAYDAGETVRFGPFAASQEGLRDGDGPVVPWTEIARATSGMPSIAIGRVWSRVEVWKKDAKEPFASHASEQVPNARVLLQLVELAVAEEAE